MNAVRNRIIEVILISFAFWWLPFSLSQKHAESQNEDFIISHVTDSYSCHFGAVHLYLPIIVYRKSQGFSCFSSKHLLHAAHGAHSSSYQGVVLKSGELIDQGGEALYDFSITQNVFFMFLSLLLLLFIFWGTSRACRRNNGIVKGGWTIPLYLVRFVRDDIVKANIGEKHYRRFLPYLLTIFFYILCNNLLGLLPGAGNVTGNISIVFVLAMTTFLVTNYNGSRYYWGHMVNPPGVPKWILPILVPIELIGIFMKPFTLMLRLFVNMLAGHLLLTAVIGLIFILNNIFIAIIAVPFGTAILLLKIFVSFVQAYVFTLLSSITIGNAVDDGH